MTSNIYAKVIYINDDKTQFVINKGSIHNVSELRKFLIVELGEKIVDPDTGEDLGALEIVKGYAKVHHIQEKMTTLISNEYIYTPVIEEVIYKNNKSRSIFNVALPQQEASSKITKEAQKTIKPLQDVKIGDCVKLI